MYIYLKNSSPTGTQIMHNAREAPQEGR